MLLDEEAMETQQITVIHPDAPAQGDLVVWGASV